jgi:hypothetical protein
MRTSSKLAAAFALGAVAAAAFLKVGDRRRELPVLRLSPAPPNSGSPSPTRVPHVPGNALQPLDTEVLVARSIEAFPAGYLLVISIIQSVTLGLLLTEAVPLTAKSANLIEVVATLSKTVTLFGAIVIISYVYLWFVVMMRWASTFRDTLIPYAIGVTEIVPSLILDRSLAWWIAASVVAATAGAALLNTITRLDLRAFDNDSTIYGAVRLLLWRIIVCCVGIVAIGLIGSILLSLRILHGMVLAVAPLALILPALMAVAINEKSLNLIFATYGISRRPLLWPRQHMT